MVSAVCCKCGQRVEGYDATCPDCGGHPVYAGGSLKTGDVVAFGRYGDGYATWRVLKVEDGEALVISRLILEARPFNSDSSKGNDWETSDLRAWLNGEFRDMAFNPEELARIKDGEITCLSQDEAASLFANEEDRISILTRVAKENGAWDYEGTSYWWLRTPGFYPSLAVIVNSTGGIRSYGWGVDNEGGGVRPVFRILLV